jgi:hypothetical protein
MGDNQKCLFPGTVDFKENNKVYLVYGPSFSYKDYNTPAHLGELVNSKHYLLVRSQLVFSALNATGHRAIKVTNTKQRHEERNSRSQRRWQSIRK